MKHFFLVTLLFGISGLVAQEAPAPSGEEAAAPAQSASDAPTAAPEGSPNPEPASAAETPAADASTPDAQSVESSPEAETASSSDATAGTNDAAAVEPAAPASAEGTETVEVIETIQVDSVQTPDGETAAEVTVTEDVIALPGEPSDMTGEQSVEGPAEVLSTPDLSGFGIPENFPATLDAAVAQENAAERARKERARYVEVRTLADKDPQVREMKEKSETAPSDEEKRAALREYYRLLFVKVKEIDPALTAHSERMEAAYLRRLQQVRVEPTIPLAPQPTPTATN